MKYKKIIYVVLIGLLLGKCVLGRKRLSYEEVEAKLEKKYGEEFIVQSSSMNSGPIPVSSGVATYYVIPKWLEGYQKGDQSFSFACSKYDKKKECRDGYLRIYAREKYRKYVEELIKPLFKEDEVYFVGSEPAAPNGSFFGVYSNKLRKDTPIEESFDIIPKGETGYLSWRYYIWIPYERYDSVEKINELSLKIAELLKGKKLLGSIDMYPYYEDKIDLFLEHKNFFLKKILTGEEYVKYYTDWRSEFHHENMWKITEQIINDELSKIYYAVDAGRDNPNDKEIKIY